MFTGIIQDIGEVIKVAKNHNGLQLTIKVKLDKGVNPVRNAHSQKNKGIDGSNYPKLNASNGVNLGDSIAINGTCLTVTEKKDERDAMQLTFDAIPETISRTTMPSLKPGDKVNIEAAIHAGEPFGGHFVQGHTDTIGTISNIARNGHEYLMAVSCPPEITGSIIEKGSIAIDGVSLTVINVSRHSFTVAVIPFTLSNTIIGKKKVGDKVNIEVDMIGKWVRKLVNIKNSKNYSDEGF